MDIDDPKEQLEAIVKAESQEQAFSLCREIIKQKPSWDRITKIINEVEDEIETIRRSVLGYAAAVIKNKKSRATDQAYLVICAFRDPFYDSGQSGLLAACYEVIHGDAS